MAVYMDLSALKKQTPIILSKRREKVSNFFTVEQLDLQFSNNKKMTYERLAGGNGAILAVPFDGISCSLCTCCSNFKRRF